MVAPAPKAVPDRSDADDLIKRVLVYRVDYRRAVRAIPRTTTRVEGRSDGGPRSVFHEGRAVQRPQRASEGVLRREGVRGKAEGSKDD